jgi:hypothetical protein
VRIPKNRIFLTVIKSIFTNKKAIPFIVIVPRKNIIVNWFVENMTGHKRIMVFDFSYTNKGICII